MKFRTRPSLALLAGLVFGSLASLGAADAATIRVPEDVGTVHQAVLDSAPGDTVLVAPGIYVEGGWNAAHDVYGLAHIEHALTLRSTAGRDSTTLRLDGIDLQVADNRIVSIESPGGAVVVEGFTLESIDTRDEGLFADTDDALRVEDCEFRGFRRSAETMHVSGPSSPLVQVLGCRFFDCGAPINSVPIVFFGTVEFLGNEIRGGKGGASIGGMARVEDCTFVEIEGEVLNVFDFGEESTVSRCTFRDNVATNGQSFLYLGRVVVEQCLIVGNVTADTQSAPSISVSHGAIRDCLVAGNVSSGPSVLRVFAAPAIRCVFVGNSGGAALSAPGESGSSCNLFWENPDGNVRIGSIDALGWEVDPQLCDPVDWQPVVRPTSPCLPQNSGLCGTYALFAEGCPSQGIVIDTDPPHLRVIADGTELTAPVYREWTEGSVHTVEAPVTQPASEGRRHAFDTWDDGGDRVHDIVVGVPGSRILATFVGESFLTMTSNPPAGGMLSPESAWFRDGTEVPILATPVAPHLFVGWQGQGADAYGGPDSAATVTVLGPITQTAEFTRLHTVAITSAPPAARLAADGLEFESPRSFEWFAGTTHEIVVLAAPDEAESGARYVFDRWSDNVSTSSREITVTGDLSVGAEFVRELRFVPIVAGQGSMVPGDSIWVRPGESLPIAATPDSGWHFVEWIGSGPGSYSGPENPIEITPEGAVTQTCVFEPDPVDPEPVARFVLSLSATDPNVASNPSPIGFVPVHLWLVCQEGPGLATFTGGIAGSISTFGFNPVPGIVNLGTATDLELVFSDCPDGPRRLGEFVILDLSGGDLCLAPTSLGLLQATNCNSDGAETLVWPTSFSIRGITTDGSVPCESGTGCPPGRQPTGVRVLVDDLRGLRPNPFRGETSVEFELEHSGVVRVSVYDVAGRLVRRLASGPQPAGPQSVTWDARGEGGGRVPAGVYFVRLEAGRFAATRKAIVLE